MELKLTQISQIAPSVKISIKRSNDNFFALIGKPQGQLTVIRTFPDY